MRSATIALCLMTSACVPALPGGTLGEPGASGRSGTGASAGAPITGGGGSIGGPVGPASGGGNVTGGGGTGGAPGPGGDDAGGASGTEFLFVADAGSPGNLAVDSDYLYWADRRGGSVMKVPLTGGAPVSVGRFNTADTLVAVDAQNIYWSTGANGRATDIVKVGKDGGEPTMIASGTEIVTRIAVNRYGVYWTANAPGVMTVNPSGGAPTLLTSAVPGFFGYQVVVDDRNVYWLSRCGTPPGDGTECINRIDASNGQAVVLARGPGGISSIAVDPAHVFWAQVISRMIMQASLDGGEPELAVSTVQSTNSIAAGAAGIYWTDGGSVFVATSATDARLVGRSGNFAIGLVLDATSVYWIGGNGSIYRAAQ